MKIIYLILVLILLVTAVVFAVVNGAPVTVNFWPFADAVEMPLFMAMTAPLYLGVIIGGVAAWLSGHKWRVRARAEARRAEALARENEALKSHPITAAPGRSADLVLLPGPATTALTPPSILP